MITTYPPSETINIFRQLGLLYASKKSAHLCPSIIRDLAEQIHWIRQCCHTLNVKEALSFGPILAQCKQLALPRYL